MFLSGRNLIDNYVDLKSFGEIRQLAGLAGLSSDLVHEPQKERGMSSGYIGSKGATFGPELNQQRISTDQKRVALDTFLKEFNFDDFDKSLNSQINSAISLLYQLEETRERISRQDIILSDAIG